MTKGMADVIRKWNRELDRLDPKHDFGTTDEISKRLERWKRFEQYPVELVDALITKFTKILNGTWYGDEPEQDIIMKYIW